MEKNEEIDTADEPEVNYRGVKAMPYIIGKRLVIASYPTLFFSFSFLFFFFLFCLNLSDQCEKTFSGNETFEKLGAIGTLSNLLLYVTVVFNMKSITATTLINIFNGTTNFATLPGAFLSDTYFGRYKTLGFASISSFMVLRILPVAHQTKI